MTDARSIWAPEAAREATPEPTPPPRPILRIALAALGVVVVAAVAVAAFVVRSRGGSAAPPTSPATSPPTTPGPSPSLVPVTDLSAEASFFSISLHWVQPPGATPVETYEVFRDGVELAFVLAPTTTYTDGTVVPGTSYSYEVEPRSSGGSVAAGRTAVSVETPVPSLASARVQGDFSVKVRVISQTGFQTFTNSYTLGWHFEPDCETGACRVTWTDLAQDSLRATLKRKGAAYSGSDSGRLNVKCGDAEVRSTLELSFEVIKAKGIDGEWRASRLKGTLMQSETAQLGCVASEAELSITATLVS
jgi:hypothetical protein